MLRQRGRVGIMAAALIGLMVGGAQAQVTTERSASILVFPRVISEGTHDTIIQITNTSNSMVFAHCFYVNGAPTFPDLPPCHNTLNCTNPPLCSPMPPARNPLTWSSEKLLLGPNGAVLLGTPAPVWLNDVWTIAESGK